MEFLKNVGLVVLGAFAFISYMIFYFVLSAFPIVIGGLIILWLLDII